MAQYLEEFIEKLSSLPIEANRNIRMIQQLDKEVSDKYTELEDKQNRYLQKVKPSKDKKNESKKEENLKLLDEINVLQDDCVALSKEKISLAQQLIENLEEYIEKVDADIKVQEQEMKQNSQVIQEQKEIKIEQVSQKKQKETNKSKLKGKSKYQLKTNKLMANAIVEQPPPIEPIGISEQNITNGKEEHYCYETCRFYNQSYGDMVSCDNQWCEGEWFHYECAGITAPPKGKWYCRNCKPNQKKDHQKS